MPSEDVKRLPMIEATYPLLDAWSARGQGRPEVPQNGSELQDDDKIWPKHPISELARTSLLLAGEHLRLIRVVLDARQLFPSAPLTTLRGALVGAAQAVWILSPNERETRQVRGLTVVAEEYVQLAKYYREGDRLDPGKSRLISGRG